MPSTYTSRARFTLQATGEGINVWGVILNSGVFQLVDDNVNGVQSFTLSGTKTLTSNNGATDEARMAILNVTGGSGGTITIPAVSKRYDIRNAASGTVTITAGGSTAVIQPGEIGSVICDGTNVFRVRPTDFGGARLTSVADPTGNQDAATKAYVDATAFNGANLPGQGPGTVNAYLKSNGTVANWAFITVGEVTGAAPAAAPSFTGGITYSGSTKANVTAAPLLDFDLSSADYFTKSISSNTTFTFSNPPTAAGGFIVVLTITAAAVPTWPASVQYDGGAPLTLGNGKHMLGFTTVDGGTTWLMTVGGRNYA